MKPLDSYNNINLATKTNILFTGVAAATLTGVSTPPTGGSYLKVAISGGTSNTGTVTINGTEVLTFAKADWKMTSGKYTTALTITTSGLADETTKPTITITAVDLAGSPINWSTTTSIPGEFTIIKPSRYAMAMLQAQGLKAPSFYKVKLDVIVDTVITIGQTFTVDGLTSTYVVWGEPTYHFQQGTDLIDSIEFTASMKN